MPLTAFDRRTAAAVVTVLRRAGLQAWTGERTGDDVEVMVPEGRRELAMQQLHQRMEEVRSEVLAAQRASRPHRRTPPPEGSRPPTPRSPEPAAPAPDPDDVHAGPPLVMERFRSMRYLAAVVMAPLLVVTLAPSLRGATGRAVALILIALAAVAVLVARARRD